MYYVGAGKHAHTESNPPPPIWDPKLLSYRDQGEARENEPLFEGHYNGKVGGRKRVEGYNRCLFDKNTPPCNFIKFLHCKNIVEGLMGDFAIIKAKLS